MASRKTETKTQKQPDDRGTSGDHAYGHSGAAQKKPFAAPAGTAERQESKRDSLTAGRAKRGKSHEPST